MKYLEWYLQNSVEDTNVKLTFLYKNSLLHFCQILQGNSLERKTKITVCVLLALNEDIIQNTKMKDNHSVCKEKTPQYIVDDNTNEDDNMKVCGKNEI